MAAFVAVKRKCCASGRRRTLMGRMSRAEADCAAEQRRLHALLVGALDDELLAGRDAILEYLATLGARTAGQQPITWRRVAYWAERYDFPLLPGVYGRRTRIAAVTSKAA